MKFTIATLAIATLTLTACGQTTETESAPATETTSPEAQAEEGVVMTVGPEEFSMMMAEEPGQLIDVRTPGEFNSGHLEGATMIDYNSSDFASQVEALDRSETVYVYCRSGGRSGRSAAILHDMGFTKVVDLSGGITAWESAGKETVQ